MLTSPSVQTCQLFGKSLKKVKELGFGRNGVVILVKDSAGKQYVMKYSHNGARFDKNEYKINQRLGRAYGYKENVSSPFFENGNNRCDVMLLEYFPNSEKEGHRGFASKKEKNLLKTLRMLEALEELLNKGICQNDVRLCNFVSCEENNDFKVEGIDFGNAAIVEHSSPSERKKHEEHLVSSLFEQACFNHEWADRILSESDYEIFKNIKSFQDAKIQLKKLLAKENSARYHSQTPAAPVVQVAVAPVLVRNQNNPQENLKYCVENGLQIGVLNALAQGAQLTKEMIVKLDDINYKQNNPKTHQVIAQAYLEHCINNGLQIGALHALEHGAKLSRTMIDKIKDTSYQRNNPKMTSAMTDYMQNRLQFRF